MQSKSMEPKKPKKWKSVIITWMAIVPIIFIIPPFLTPRLTAIGLNSILAQLISTTVLVIMMVYIALPVLTKLFAKWLNK